MRMPRIGFTVGWLMTAVAAAGCLAGAEAMRRRSSDFRRLADIHKLELCEIGDENLPDLDGRGWGFWVSDDPDRRPSPSPANMAAKIAKWEKSKDRRIAFHASMYRKYERAARYPWLAVEPDPPEPE
jgi:hypothetical protein